MLLSAKLVDIILKEGLPFIYFSNTTQGSDKGFLSDDATISNLLNSHWVANGEEYKNHIRGLRHGWYKCISTNANSHNTICSYFEDRKDPEFWKTFVTVQMKCYREREREYDNYMEFHSIVCGKIATDEESIEINEYYYDRFNVFIGSILGYIKYDEWKQIDKYKLYDIEINNKASDDEQRYFEKKPFIYVKYNVNKEFSI